MRATAGTGIFVGMVIAAVIGSAAFAQDIAYDINQIQRALVARGYNIGSVDGLWGRRSINALAAFQKSHGLRAKGELNDVTVKRLLESPQPQAAMPALPPTTSPTIGTPSPTSPLLPIPALPQAVMVEQTLPAPLSESVSHPLGSVVPSAVISPPKVISMSISSQSLEAIRAGALAAGAVAIAIAVVFLFVRRRRTAQIVQNAGASSTGHVSIASSTQLSPPPISKSSSAHPEVNQPIKPVASNVQISPDLTASIAAHNAEVEKAITARLAEDAILSAMAATVNLENSNRDLSLFTKDGTQFIALKERLAAHNANVKQAIHDAHQKNKNQPFIARSTERPSQDDSPQFNGWIPANQPITVGNHVIPGGLIYVGDRLPQTAHVHRAENCLINPRLAIASRGDPGGHTMGYWPSYSEITAEARRSYLDWLAGPRSDPSTYIGYVFLYFYGLERRLMLEKGAPDAGLIIAEVRRLMRIYGSHSSFRRYAQEILSAYELQEAREPETVVPSPDTGSYGSGPILFV